MIHSLKNVVILFLSLFIFFSSFCQAQNVDYDTQKWTELSVLDNTITLDMRYATTNNFVKAQMYDCGRCFVRPEAAKAVAKAHKILKDKGYGGLKMFDCYRPRPYQKRLWDKMPDSRYVTPPWKGSQHTRGLAVDLSSLGHSPWLDEWEILGGESIPTKIATGIEESDYIVLVLSKYAVTSNWVEQEWQAKYWAEITNYKVSIIPILIDDCVIPTLLRTKKYIDFREDYTLALEQLANSVNKLMQKKAK